MKLFATKQTSIAGSSRKVWTPADNFKNGEQGFWLDPTSFSNIYQDSAGTSPVTAVQQPAGLVLDKRLGLVLGPNLAINGGPFSNTTGWTTTTDASISVDAGRLKLVTTSAAKGVGTAVTCGIGKRYRVTCSGFPVSSPVRMAVGSQVAAGEEYDTGVNAVVDTAYSFTFVAARALEVITFFSSTAGTSYYNNISVRELPGNHFSQATSTSRPKVRARVNLLTKTEQFDDAVWADLSAGTTTRTANYGLGPNDGVTADRLQGNNANTWLGNTVSGNHAGQTMAYSMWVRTNSGTPSGVSLKIGANGGATTSQSVAVTSAWQRFQVVGAIGSSETGDVRGAINHGDGNDLLVWGAQLEVGTTASRYQRVSTATDYDTAGFLQSLAFDGLDDSLSTGPITLGADMDCFVAIRRNSAARCLLAYASSGEYFGVAEAGNSSSASNVLGNVTYVVNGVGVNGGAPGVTRDQLHLATPVAGWVIVEIRNINMALWADFKISGYPTFQFDGGIGGIILCPAGSEATRAKNRKWLGAKVGLTL